MSHERAAVFEKRKALKKLVASTLRDFNEDFNVYQIPTRRFLSASSRLGRLEVQENTGGEIRQANIFWDGPATEGSPEDNIAGLFRKDESQYGSVAAFRVVIMYGIQGDPSYAVSRFRFEELFAYNVVNGDKKGLLPKVRETRSLETEAADTVLLSTPENVVIPPAPRSLQSGDEEYAHYGEFRVFLTDM